jgi:multidrug efflux pump subunit AcrB
MSEKHRKGLIAWFATNPVAANLMMLLIITLGIYAGVNLKRSMMPEFDIDMVQVTMAYPGAAPEEVEQGIVLKIEEALADLDGIKRVESTAAESMAFVMVEPENEDDIVELINDVKTRVDAIPHFPEGAEKPIVGRIQLPIQALMVQLSGDLDERSMKELAEQVKLDLIAHPDISSVEIWGARDYEIAIEISEDRLREYHLTLGQVANIVATSSIDMPGGSVRTENGDIMLRTQGQAYRQADFESIVLKTFADGTRLTLGEIARIEDGFTDTTGFSIFNGKYSIGLAIMARGEQDILKAARATKSYVEEQNQILPDSVKLVVWQDGSYWLEEGLGMMMKNLTMGALVVFIVLALFLEIKLAFWVMIGIPICFLGAIALFASPLVGGTLNMISIFGFILVLGIVVDDAIIIGESAYSEQERHGHSVDSIIRGTHRVATPATFGVLTTIMAFLPQLFLDGFFAAFAGAMASVVVLCLMFSLIESKLILPAHLAHSKPAESKWLVAVDHIQEAVNKHLKRFVKNRYRPFIAKCIEQRYMTLAVFISAFILTIGMVAGGKIRLVMQPEVEGEFLSMDLTMSEGTPQARTLEAMREIGLALEEVDAEYQVQTGDGSHLVAHTFAFGGGLVNGTVVVELTLPDDRSIGTKEVMHRWRTAVGEVPGAEALSFNAMDGGPKFGADIEFDLRHPDWEVLKAASLELEEKFKSYDGLYDIQSTATDSAKEFHIDILPQAEALGITRLELGSQVRHAFYGAEAQRIQRGTHEIKVMVRYPREDRRNTASLDGMFIRTPNGDEVPFASVASLEAKEGLNKTTHINFQRAVAVSAEAEVERVEPGKITADIIANFLPQLVQKYPGLTYGRAGMSEEEEKMTRGLFMGFVISLFGIYALLAIPTKSYLQPLIIMGVIPFGTIGAVIGHMITGYAMSMFSMMGVVALSGVVVNDSLIMVDFINRAVKDGSPPAEAAVNSGTRRFRAILLTSLTTFFGLMPLLLETSTQAQMIQPMAISLAFGIVFATVITLLLVPCLYMILQDFSAWWSKDSSAEPLNNLTGKV